MSELTKRIDQLADAIDRAEETVEQHGRNGVSTFANLRRLCRDVRSWSEHVELAAEQGALVRLTDGGVEYYRPELDG